MGTGERTGVVTSFDEAAGLGELAAGDAALSFHCIEIADGTRTIAVGAHVRFEVLAKLGRYEAGSLRPA